MKNLNPQKKDSNPFLKIEFLTEKKAYGSESSSKGSDSLDGRILKLCKGSKSLRNGFESPTYKCI